jgi:hypothetical protein
VGPEDLDGHVGGIGESARLGGRVRTTSDIAVSQAR